MFFYDVFGILFLILVATFLLFLPLATGGLLMWGVRRLRLAWETHRRFHRHPLSTNP
ncbi:MAG: hypothetical protein HYX74_09180 [Acidobacteria bacterium]|nr:hypothetical protein [Acidobacteriota bacterium]